MLVSVSVLPESPEIDIYEGSRIDSSCHPGHARGSWRRFRFEDSEVRHVHNAFVDVVAKHH